MKTLVQCQCGSAFNAPASLVGQVVKCPACGNAMTVPDAGVAAQSPATARRAAAQAAGKHASGAPEGDPAAGGAAGVSGLGAAGRAGRSGSSVAGSAMRSGVRPAAGGGDNPNLSRDLCPRCKAVVTEGGRLCTTCLYELHTGQSAGARGKFKFTLGLGVAVAVLLIAASVGLWIVLNADHAVPTVASDDRQAQTSDTAVAASPDAAAPGDAAGDAAATADADRSQAIEPGRQWSSAGLTLASTIRGASVVADLDPASGTQRFDVVVAPASGASLRMGTTVRLFRGESADGPFTQVDAGRPTGTESGGALTFTVRDATAAETGHNRVFYRLSGDDGLGVRLFDTPAAGFPVITSPRVAGGRVTWRPVNPDEPAPPLRLAFMIDSPDWAGLLVDQVSAEGELDVPLPATQGLPLKAVAQVAAPTRIELASGAAASWESSEVSYTLHQAGSGDRAAQGVMPYWESGRLAYRFIPGPDAFQDVVEQAPETPEAPTDGSRLLSFRVPSTGSVQLLELPAAPMVRHVAVTPLDRRVRISWDNRELLAAADRYAGKVAVAIYRQMDGGPWQVVAMVPPAQTSHVDTTVTNGRLYRYEVRLTSASSADASPLLRADAFLAGRGNLPVLVPVQPRMHAGAALPENGLTAFTVAIGRAELAYPYTDERALGVLQAVRSALLQTPGVTVIERDELMRGRAAAGGLLGSADQFLGSPAHVQLRVLDASTPAGLAIELWAIDVASGIPTRIAAAPMDEADPGAFASALKALIEPRLPAEPAPAPAGEAPGRLVFAPPLPMDQPAPFLGGVDLAEDLAERAARGTEIEAVAAGPSGGFGDPLGGPGSVLITGRAWQGEERDPSVMLQAIDAATGRSLGTFVADPLDRAAEDRLVEWCGGLKTPAGAVTPAGFGFGERSSLLEAEARLGAIHPVWQEMAGSGVALSSRLATAPALPSMPGGVHVSTTFNIGLPMPTDLSPYQPTRRRDASDPLASVRPFIASADPATFDAWVAGYARYLPRDYEAFVHGLEQLARAARAGAMAPKLFVRGEEVFTGGAMVDGPIPVSRDPQALNVRGFLPLGATNEPAIRYRAALEETFRARPYAAYHAWKQAPRDLAEPFLRGVLLGVEKDAFGRSETDFSLPPEFDKYLAACALAEMGNPQGATFRRRAIDVSVSTYQELAQRGLLELTDRQSHYVTNAMLILAFEGDPTVIRALRDPKVLEAFVKPQPAVAADVVRMLVDREVPSTWQWVSTLRGMDWSGFLWRSPDEMRLVTDMMPDALPAEMYAHVRRMLGAGAVERPNDRATPVNPPSSNLARPMFGQ